MVKPGICKSCHKGVRSNDKVCSHCGESDPYHDIEHEIRKYIAQGNKVGAVKRVVELTGFGLKESKDYVDSLL